MLSLLAKPSTVVKFSELKLVQFESVTPKFPVKSYLEDLKTVSSLLLRTETVSLLDNLLSSTLFRNSTERTVFPSNVKSLKDSFRITVVISSSD